jgi:demethylmenaquinone methyltransferase/2-methoxy-6-polyprenyl-1,4-benzoquinol methylase
MEYQVNKILQEQINYYRARAGEYDEWFLRQGRFDRGDQLNQLWFSEVAKVRQALDQFKPTGAVLELACGTGLWTQQLATFAEHITAVDASAEVIELNRQRLQNDKVTYLQADLFAWEPANQYDVIFFSFWLSHVPPERFEQFWDLVRIALKPDGKFFLVDSRYDPTSTAINHSLGEAENIVRVRKLNDGSSFQVFKIFYKADELAKKIGTFGWQTRIIETENYFIYGSGKLK